MNSHIVAYYDRLIDQAETFSLVDLATTLAVKRKGYSQ